MTEVLPDATALAEAIRGGLITAGEACQEALDRIDRQNPALNSVVIDLRAGVRERAAVASGPFAGVPTLLKDLGACLDGLPLYQGNELLRRLDWRASGDSPLARRLVDAGFVLLGKTNTPEFGAGVTTQPRSFGPARNPWDLHRSTSGSSGGAAAAVAAGLVPLAHGNDFAGSIRLPAAWCGVVGLKPSRGRIDTGGPPGAVVEFVLTRSLRDAAGVLDVVADAGAARRPFDGWLASSVRTPAPSRIGLLRGVDGVATDPDLADRAEEAARELAGAGHEIVVLDDPFLADEAWERMQLIVRARGARARLEALSAIVGRPLAEDEAEPLMFALADRTEEFSAADVEAAGAWQLRYAEELSARWARAALDALVSPTAGLPPMLLDDLVPPPDDPVAIYGWFRRIGAFTGAWNMTGQPAISIPWWTPPADRLPAGVQIVGRPHDEDLVLRLAHQLSIRRPERTAVRQP